MTNISTDRVAHLHIISIDVALRCLPVNQFILWASIRVPSEQYPAALVGQYRAVPVLAGTARHVTAVGGSD